MSGVSGFFVRDSGQHPVGKGHKPYGKETVLLYFVRVEVETYLSLIARMIIQQILLLLP